jgi:hypothetical protein
MPIGMVSTVRDSVKGSFVCFPKEKGMGIGIISAWAAGGQFLVEIEFDKAIFCKYDGPVCIIHNAIIEPAISSIKSFRHGCSTPSQAIVCVDEQTYIAFLLDNGDTYYVNTKTGYADIINSDGLWFSEWVLYYEMAGDFKELIKVKI